MSMVDPYHQMEHLLLKERGKVECITLNVFAGCPSDDGDSIRSDGTDEYVLALAYVPVSRRKRKMLQPKRAAMYGSEVEGICFDSTAESHYYRPRPVKQHVEIGPNPIVTPRPASAPQKPAPAAVAASKPSRPSSSTAAKSNKKSCNPVCGPCGNCGTTTSPQWRHGNSEKPIVCNACGIRYLRTGTFQKAGSDKKRAASGGSGAVSGGAHHAKRWKTDSQPTSSADTYPEDNVIEAMSRPGSRATTDSRRRSRSPATDTAPSTAASSHASPAITAVTADAASTPPSPLRLDGPGTNNAAGTIACAVNHHTPAGQQHVPTHRGRHSLSGSRLGPSPLGRVSMPAEPPAVAVVPGQHTAYTAPAAPAPSRQITTSSAPCSAGGAADAASSPAVAVATAPTNSTAAGTTAAQPVIQPELLQLVSILAARMGSIDAAIAYLKATAGGMAANTTRVSAAGTPAAAEGPVSRQ